MIAIRLLGPVEVDADGTKVALTRPLERALLARLALDPGQPVASTRLVDDLWGDNVPRDALASLQGLVYRLRRTLGDDGRHIVRVGSGYALDEEDVAVDLAAFTHLVAVARTAQGAGDMSGVGQALRDALDLWRGPPLGGLGAVPFVPSQVTRLEAARLSALGDRLEADLAVGHHGEVVAELESLVSEYPYEEGFWAQLMLARYRSGSQADALRCYSRLRAVLKEELGIEPGPAVTALEQAILRHDTELDWSPAPRGPLRPWSTTGARHIRGGVPSPVGAPFRGREPGPLDVAVGADEERSDLSWVAPGDAGFVGRHLELDITRAARRRAAKGERVLVLVTGEPGIGKTRLTAEMAREFDAAGDLVLHGRWDEEPLCPYQAFREALGRYAQEAPRQLVRADVGPLLPGLARIVPELLEGGPGPEPSTASVAEGAAGADDDGDRYRVFDAVRRWVDAMAARRRLMLVLDDLHWADRPSMLLLEYLLRSASLTQVMIVATYRPTEANVPGWFSECLAGIRRTAYVENVALGGLSEAETRQLVEAELGRALSDSEAAGTANLQRRTGGNPFFLHEVVRDLDEGGRSLEAWSATGVDEPFLPDRLRDVVHWRLRHLSGVCMRILTAASVMGEEFDIDTVGRAVDCDDETLLMALDEARAAAVVHESSRAFDTHRFAHAVVRQALYEDTGLSRRARLHRRMGEALAARYGAEAPHHAAELAVHFFLGASAGGTEDALRYLHIAAEDALQRVAYEAAADYLARALEIVTVYRPGQELERCRLLLAIGAAYVRAGRTGEADVCFLDAFATASAAASADLVAEAALGYGGVLPAGSEPNPEARALLESALAALPDADGRARALVLGRLAQWGHFERPRAERAALAGEAVAMARRLGDPGTLAAVLGYRYWALDGPDDPEGQLAVALEIRHIGEETGDREVTLHGLKCELHSRFEVGDFAASKETARALGALAQRVRQPEYLRLQCMWDSLVAGIEGRYADAEQSASDAVAILERTEHSHLNALYVGLSLPWRWLQGRMEELRILLEIGRTGRASAGETALVAWVASEIGEPDQARVALDRLSPEVVAAEDRHFHWWLLVVGLVQTSLNLADRRWAGALYDMVEPYAAHNCRAGQATFLGAASLHLGALALLLGRDDEATMHLEQAVVRHLDMGARPFAAVTEQMLAAALRRSGGDHDRADALEADARRHAESLGIRLPPVPPPSST